MIKVGDKIIFDGCQPAVVSAKMSGIVKKKFCKRSPPRIKHELGKKKIGNKNTRRLLVF